MTVVCCLYSWWIGHFSYRLMKIQFIPVQVHWSPVKNSQDKQWPKEIVFPNPLFAATMTTPGASQVALVVENPCASAGDVRDMVLPLGREDPLEEDIATHSSILAWRIPWTEEPGATVHRVTKSQTWLKWLSMHTHTKLSMYWLESRQTITK